MSFETESASWQSINGHSVRYILINLMTNEIGVNDDWIVRQILRKNILHSNYSIFILLFILCSLWIFSSDDERNLIEK